MSNPTPPGAAYKVATDTVDGNDVQQVKLLDPTPGSNKGIGIPENPMTTNDDTVGSLLRRILTLLMSPRGYDKSLARQRVTSAVESLPTLNTCNTVGTVGNMTQIAGRDGVMLINPTNRTSWALNHRSRIT